MSHTVLLVSAQPFCRSNGRSQYTTPTPYTPLHGLCVPDGCFTTQKLLTECSGVRRLATTTGSSFVAEKLHDALHYWVYWAFYPSITVHAVENKDCISPTEILLNYLAHVFCPAQRTKLVATHILDGHMYICKSEAERWSVGVHPETFLLSQMQQPVHQGQCTIYYHVNFLCGILCE